MTAALATARGKAMLLQPGSSSRSESRRRGTNAQSPRVEAYRFSGAFSWGKIEWRKVFEGQPWVLLVLAVALLLVPGAAYEFKARHRDTYYSKPIPDSYPGESLLSRPFTEHETVPTWLLGVLMALMMATLAGVELLLAPRFHPNGTAALRMAVFLLVDAAIANVVVYAAVAFTKASVGRLRPDFFARLDSGDNSTIIDGRKSYPSGHSATSFACGMYWALHLTWSFHFRPRARTAAAPPPARLLQWRRDLGAFVKIVAVAVGPAVALYIAISRIWDYRHNPSDVNAGALLGIVGTTFLWARGNSSNLRREAYSEASLSRMQEQSELGDLSSIVMGDAVDV